MHVDSSLPVQPPSETKLQEGQPLIMKEEKQLSEDTSQKDKLEFLKIIIDYLKHTATLSTGSILILATFLEKFFTRPTGKLLVIFALFCFGLSIVGAFIVGVVCITDGDPGKPKVENSSAIIGYVVLATFAFFIFGIFLFMCAAYINFL